MIFTEPEYRVEGPLKVTGAAQYTADVAMPGMLWLAYTRSTHAHALLKGVETRAAQAVPGVHAVLTGADTGNVRLGVGCSTGRSWPRIACGWWATA